MRKHLKYIIGLALVSSLVVGAYALVSTNYNKFVIERETITHAIISTQADEDDPTNQEKIQEQNQEFTDQTINQKDTVSILIIGTDRSGYLTDVMMAVHHDPNTHATSLFSIPRDYKITLTENVQQHIRYHAPYLKLTELHSYAKMAGLDQPASYTTQAVEEMLGLSFDHIVVFNIDAFKMAVDLIGGVELYVPMDMDYDDPDQSLHIHLKQGYQLLDGDLAEQFVRFRKDNNNKGYGDFGRMEMQQYFLKAYLKKIINLDQAFHLPQIFDELSQYIKTDATLTDAIKLMNLVKVLDTSQISSHTLPGENAKINGIYYYNPPPVQELKTYVAHQINHDNTTSLTKLNYAITILNGNGKFALAEEYKDRLTDEGYIISSTGDYTGARAVKTKIYVPDPGIGYDLINFFKLAEVIIDKEMTKDYEIVIVLGRVEM